MCSKKGKPIILTPLAKKGQGGAKDSQRTSNFQQCKGGRVGKKKIDLTVTKGRQKGESVG